MEESLHYDIRDVLIAPARALSAKRILVMTSFLIVGILIYDLFAYAAVAADGGSLKSVWSLYGLSPLTWFKLNGFWAGLLYGIGLALGLLALMIGFFGVSAIEIEQIRGNRFLSATAAVRFAVKRVGQIIVSELSVLLFLLLIVVLILIYGLITRIPVVGEWIYTLTFVLPGFILALFSVFILFVLSVSVILLPAVAAAERKGEAFAAILETFSTIIRQPVRWLVYTVYALIAAKVCSFVYAYFCYRAVQFLAWGTSLSAGDRAVNLVKSGLSHLPVRSDFVEETLRVFPGIDFSFSISQWARGGADEAAGHVMAVMLFLIFASIIGYALATVAVAQTRGYVVLRYIKDDYEIPDENSLFFRDEHVNEPIEEPSPDNIAPTQNRSGSESASADE